MKKTKERRRRKRWQVAVLVRCAIPKFGNEMYDLEMWARDVNEKGLKLEWTRGLSISQVSKERRPKVIRFEDVQFAKGARIKVQDLFYDDEGSPFIEGRILWARRNPATATWSLGIGFDDSKRQPRELMEAFRDFLSIVKNPTDAIAKASR